MSDYQPTIGIECHVQLKSKTKLFAGVDNDAREADPNTLISHICLGLPGALPVLNKEVVRLASKAAFALNTRPQTFSKFDRKHYFYPDLPKGYQISQYDEPIIVGGYVEIEVEGKTKRINITRAHIEEDAGKNTHPAGSDYSLVDLNRAGTPLLEIVSEPEIKSAAEAKAYARELYLLMKYADVSDVDLYHGNMRFDVNVSLSNQPGKLGVRTETKNLNSFRSIEKAVEYEVKRQTELLEHDKPVTQETRGWDDAKQKTFSQRSKEEAHDYRYFPDPDLPPIELTKEFIDSIEESMPLMPSQYRELFSKLGLDKSATETLLESAANAQFIQQIIEKSGSEHARRIANWIVNMATRSENDAAINVRDTKLTMESAVELSQLVADKKLSSTAAKEIWLELSYKGGAAVKIAEARNLIQESDEGQLSEITETVLKENVKAAEDVKNGEMKAIGFLVGQVMKASGGKANPQVVQQLIKKQLGL
jgi:aspartyl-tRNA(Asn)/glutamyl-tRNA(Gln) amidotransferase subunit B